MTNPSSGLLRRPGRSGCVDSLASNFASLANVDDGSCRYDVVGCTDANAQNFDERIPVSNETEFGRVSTMSYMTSAFEILANIHIYDSSRESKTNAATSKILSRRLLGSKNYKMLVANTKEIWNVAKHFGLSPNEPFSYLASFPSTSSNLQRNNYYLRENSFDLSSLLDWFANIGMVDVENDALMNDVNDELEKASLLHHLTASELFLMESWKHFVEIAVYKMYSSNDYVISSSCLQILDELALDTLKGLNKNLDGAVVSQLEVSTNFMYKEIFRMSSCLSDLLLFLLEIGAFGSLPLQELVEISGVVSKVMGNRQNISFPQQTEEYSNNQCLEVRLLRIHSDDHTIL